MSNINNEVVDKLCQYVGFKARYSRQCCDHGCECYLDLVYHDTDSSWDYLNKLMSISRIKPTSGYEFVFRYGRVSDNKGIICVFYRDANVKTELDLASLKVPGDRRSEACNLDRDIVPAHIVDKLITLEELLDLCPILDSDRESLAQKYANIAVDMDEGLRLLYLLRLRDHHDKQLLTKIHIALVDLISEKDKSSAKRKRHESCESEFSTEPEEKRPCVPEESELNACAGASANTSASTLVPDPSDMNTDANMRYACELQNLELFLQQFMTRGNFTYDCSAGAIECKVKKIDDAYILDITTSDSRGVRSWQSTRTYKTALDLCRNTYLNECIGCTYFINNYIYYKDH